MSDRRAFADFDPSPWPELAWADGLTVDEAAEFAGRRESCPDLIAGEVCCKPGTCHRSKAVVTMFDCYQCLDPKIGTLKLDV